MDNKEIEKILDRKKKGKKGFQFLSKLLLLGIIFFIVLIYAKMSDSNKLMLHQKVFGKTIHFTAINKWYNEHFGKILPIKNLMKEVEPVFHEELEYTKENIYKDGVALTVSNEYLVPVLHDGIVNFVGNKEDYGKTVIIEQSDGTEAWYANVTNLNIGLYDYVDKGEFLGQSINDVIYLVFKKDGKVVDYKKYIE